MTGGLICCDGTLQKPDRCDFADMAFAFAILASRRLSLSTTNIGRSLMEGDRPIQAHPLGGNPFRDHPGISRAQKRD